MKRPVTVPRIERFLKLTGWGPSRLGRAINGDPGLVQQMRAGRAVGEELDAQIAAFIERYVEDEAARVRALRAMIR